MASSDAFAKLTWLLTLASIAIAVAAVYFAKPVLVPFTLAVLMSFLLAPICEWLERWRMGRIAAVIGTVLLAFVVLTLVAWTVALQVTELAGKLPEYKNNSDIRELVEEFGKQQREIQSAPNQPANAPTDNSKSASSKSERRCVLCLPARGEVDEIAGTMFLQILEHNGFATKTVSIAALASEMIHLVEQSRGDVICISAMPPAAVSHARSARTL